MDREILERVGLALYGAQWQSPLARDLGVAIRTLTRWHTGAFRPPDLTGELLALCEGRGLEIARLIGELDQTDT